MDKFWNWLQDRLGIESIDVELEGIDCRLDDLVKELAILRKKVTGQSQRFDQVERSRSERKHPARHH